MDSASHMLGDDGFPPTSTRAGGPLPARSIALKPDRLGANPSEATHRLCDLGPVACPFPARSPLYQMGIVPHCGGVL